MDPLSAAGVGLSVGSLVFQIFAGCIRGYQFLIDADGLPQDYRHIRIRLRLEQARLLTWGESLGLLEESLQRPTQILHLNRNLIFDVLLEINNLMKRYLEIDSSYGPTVTADPFPTPAVAHYGAGTNSRLPRNVRNLLERTLNTISKTPQLSLRLKWAAVGKKEVESVLEKLIGYNDSIESLLDEKSCKDLQDMQSQIHMTMLQLSDKVQELQEIARAMTIQKQINFGEDVIGLPSETQGSHSEEENSKLYRLAAFKAEQSSLEFGNSIKEVKPITRQQVKIINSSNTRPEAIYRGQRVWIEWKDYSLDYSFDETRNAVITNRVKRLVVLLSSTTKPPEFHTPQCLGYFDDVSDDTRRHAFVYNKPGGPNSTLLPVSLFDMIQNQQAPSLTQRINLARSIARSVMYLHAVNWLHKGIQSDNIIFFAHSTIDYSSPIVSGFSYSRPDLPEEVSEQPPLASSYDPINLYRHPSLHQGTAATLPFRLSARSQKSHDLYALGLLLVEIAHWKALPSIIDTLAKPDQAHRTSSPVSVATSVLSNERMNLLKSLVGSEYAEIVRKLVHGRESVGSFAGADETKPDVGAEMQRVFYHDIVLTLERLRI